MSEEMVQKEEITEEVVVAKKEKKQRGAGLIEYALLAAIVVGIAVIAKNSLSTNVSRAFSGVNSGMDNALN